MLVVLTFKMTPNELLKRTAYWSHFVAVNGPLNTVLGGMLAHPREIEQQGFSVVEPLIDLDQSKSLISALPDISNSGSRTLLSIDRFRDLALQLRTCHLAFLLSDLVAIQCIYFKKTAEQNWGVRMHRDRVLPVSGTGPWPDSGTKEGMQCAKPPREFLDRCIVVRVHLDGSATEDLRVVPGSHKDSNPPDFCISVSVPVSRGGALIMRPTLLHASSKLVCSKPRRVLHYVYAPTEIPENYRWYDAA